MTNRRGYDPTKDRPFKTEEDEEAEFQKLKELGYFPNYSLLDSLKSEISYEGAYGNQFMDDEDDDDRGQAAGNKNQKKNEAA